MFKPGSSFTISMKRIPLELSIELRETSSNISLSYGTWVLFDTGDLKKELARIVHQIEQNSHELVEQGVSLNPEL
ncbi:MAG: hypothetical protein HQL32_04360 [Planctomycetes bacterium]|nr:hypothetical protein [Planctomycetota bacterium]